MQAGTAKSCPSCGERYGADVLFCPRDGTPLTGSRKAAASFTEADPYAGLELAGQIRIQHLIGIGSMGRVYRAFQGGIDRDVAVKILHRELSGNVELTGRFHREAKIASRLVHPNVVQVLMSGAIPRGADPHVGGELYLVMEHLDGISLLSALAAAGTGGEEGALPLPRALHVMLQVCDAVGEAHAQGIVHRDLKPENIMLVRRSEDPDFVKVLDFGIARLEWADKSVSTQAGLIFGTAKYISPEGAEGQPVGPQADVYSIATVLYQCLAGRAPFEGDSPVALLVQHTHAPPPELRSIARASYVPAPIAQVIMQNLAKRPGERARDARALGRDLAVAVRESGLDPDEIAGHPGIARSAGVVKLASKARTRALELSPELAARIGGVAAAPRAPDSGAGAAAELDHGEHGEAPLEVEAPVSARASRRSQPDGSGAQDAPARASRPSLPDATPLPIASQRRSVPEVAPPAPDLDFDAGAAPEPEEDAGAVRPELEAPSTMHGVASEARPLPRRARIARVAAIVACAAAAALVAVLGGRQIGSFGGPGPDSIEAQVERARDCMRRHAWDAPPGENVKEIAERARARWPADARVDELRREASERLIADALGRRYAGDVPDALRLARLALELAPAYTTAQHLVAELSAAPAPALEPGAALAPATSASVRRAGPPGARPAASAAPAASSSARAGAEQKPAPAASASDKPESPTLPPTPPPLPTEPAALPPPSGPWL